MTGVAPPRSRGALLVVEDDASIRDAIRVIVEIEGYRVVTASDGAEALGYLLDGLRPALILLDLRMPGMDGRTFRDRQTSHAELADIPVVLLSGDRDGREIAAELGTDHIPKPIDLDVLLSVVSRFVDASG